MRVLKIAVIVGLVALLSGVAWGQDRRGRDGGRDGGRNGDGEHRHRRGCGHDRPTSAVPEPSAALLFGGGSLIVAQAIRASRKRKV